MDDLLRRRLKRNEAVFRTVNEEIDELGDAGAGAVGYVCECADASCTETITLTHREYRRIRTQPAHFVVAPGHELPEIEHVVERAADHVVVEKT